MKKYRRLERRKLHRLAAGKRIVKNTGEQSYLSTLLQSAARNQRKLDALKKDVGVAGITGAESSCASATADTLSPWFITKDMRVMSSNRNMEAGRRYLSYQQLSDLMASIIVGQVEFLSTIKRIEQEAKPATIDDCFDSDNFSRWAAVDFANRRLNGAIYPDTPH